jgi:hypothetical protein
MIVPYMLIYENIWHGNMTAKFTSSRTPHFEIQDGCGSIAHISEAQRNR